MHSIRITTFYLSLPASSPHKHAHLSVRFICLNRRHGRDDNETKQNLRAHLYRYRITYFFSFFLSVGCISTSIMILRRRRNATERSKIKECCNVMASRTWETPYLLMRYGRESSDRRNNCNTFIFLHRCWGGVLEANGGRGRRLPYNSAHNVPKS